VTALHVDGADETARALAKTAVDVKDLPALAEVASTAADVMRGFIPVWRGDARDTIKGTSTKGEAVVTFGGPRAPHAFAIARNHPSRFVQRTDRLMETRAAEILDDGLTDTFTRNGLST
jgi:hypothetical protein